MNIRELDLHTLNYQQGKKGKFRMIETRMGIEGEWINKVYCHDWYYTFKYENGEKFELHFDTTGRLSTIS